MRIELDFLIKTIQEVAKVQNVPGNVEGMAKDLDKLMEEKNKVDSLVLARDVSKLMEEKNKMVLTLTDEKKKVQEIGNELESMRKGETKAREMDNE